jgi:hypothetical protein
VRHSLFPIFFIFVAILVHQSDAQSASLDSRRAELKRLLSEEWDTLRTSPEFATIGSEVNHFERARLHRLRKNPDFTAVLKGRGFEPRRKCRIFTRGFSR